MDEFVRNVLGGLPAQEGVDAASPEAAQQPTPPVDAAIPTGVGWAGLPERVPSPSSSDLVKALEEIAIERKRQIKVEGWTPEHDDEHDNEQMAQAAAAYALATFSPFQAKRQVWPWDFKWWKPRSHRENLVRAGALIVAEIERLDRSALRSHRGEK